MVVVAVIATVPSVPFDILSPLPKVMSFPLTVRSPLTDVVVAVTATVPSVPVSYTHLTLPTKA